MAFSLNLVQLIGRTGGEPTMRYMPSGQAVTTFSLATDRRASKGDDATAPDWHRVVAFARLGEFCNTYLSKGRLVYLSGRLCYRTWTGQDGQPRHGTEIVAHEVVLLDRRPTGDASPAAEPEPADGDDLPFG